MGRNHPEKPADTFGTGKTRNYFDGTKTVIKAIRYICLTEPAKIFSFTLSDENTALLADVAEKYTISRIQRGLSALEFYKAL